jgi:hypothetical protein
MIEAVAFARSVSKDITAVYVEFEQGAGQAMSKSGSYIGQMYR